MRATESRSRLTVAPLGWCVVLLVFGPLSFAAAQTPLISPLKKSATALLFNSDLTDEEVRLLRDWISELARKDDRRQNAALVATDQVQMPADEKPAQQEQPPKFDPALVAAGEGAFSTSCTQCHDAERSLGKQKSLGSWRATVRRMANKNDADIPGGEIEPIATYLASLSPAATTAGSSAAAQPLSLFSTVSLIHRSGVRDALENQGFFPEVWVGAQWQGSGPISARVQACVTCHTENSSVSARVELAEGVLQLDVDRWLFDCDDSPLQVGIDGGRFIVPFGAFAAKSHAGANRMATRPLMYNMGQNVYRSDLGAPLLPMPYSDEGVQLNVSNPLFSGLTATFDGYAINGLQGGSDLNLAGFYSSRDYTDNNSEPAIGGRVTVGNKMFRGGASIMSGRFNNDGVNAFPQEVLDYKIYGFDFTARYRDLFRATVEYARRENDQFSFANGTQRVDFRGLLAEAEVKLLGHPKVSAIVRYDEQRRFGGNAISGSRITNSDFSVRRFTYGLNFTIGNSTLMINHERWNVPDPLNDLDVLAIRWVASF